MGCGASNGRKLEGSELDQFLTPYVGKWIDK
jgi:hypothetical protein